MTDELIRYELLPLKAKQFRAERFNEDLTVNVLVDTPINLVVDTNEDNTTFQIETAILRQENDKMSYTRLSSFEVTREELIAELEAHALIYIIREGREDYSTYQILHTDGQSIKNKY
jgi:hypothetical protein